MRREQSPNAGRMRPRWQEDWVLVRTLFPTVAALLFLSTLLSPAAAGQAPPQLPVGYEEPGTHQGGPSIPDGLGWIDVVQPRALPLAPKPAGGRLTVVALVSSTGAGVLHASEQARRRLCEDARAAWAREKAWAPKRAL